MPSKFTLNEQRDVFGERCRSIGHLCQPHHIQTFGLEKPPKATALRAVGASPLGSAAGTPSEVDAKCTPLAGACRCSRGFLSMFGVCMANQKAATLCDCFCLTIQLPVPWLRRALQALPPRELCKLPCRQVSWGAAHGTRCHRVERTWQCAFCNVP